MKYRVDRIGYRSVVRFLSLIGLVVCALPGLCMAGLAVTLLAHMGRTLAGLRQFAVTLPPQAIGPLRLEFPPIPIDLVDRLGLTQAERTVAVLDGHLGWMFIVFTVVLVAVGTAALVFAGVVAIAAYNMAARLTGGVAVMLRPDE